jgi:hypothetical protein
MLRFSHKTRQQAKLATNKTGQMKFITGNVIDDSEEEHTYETNSDHYSSTLFLKDCNDLLDSSRLAHGTMEIHLLAS